MIGYINSIQGDGKAVLEMFTIVPQTIFKFTFQSKMYVAYLTIDYNITSVQKLTLLNVIKKLDYHHYIRCSIKLALS